MKKLLLPENVGTEVIKYLVQRPYREVHHLVDALRSLQYHEPPAEKPDETPPE